MNATTNDVLKGAVIGVGYFSQFHLEAWRRLEGVQLTAVCDLETAKAERAAKDYGVENHYSDVDRLFAEQELDFVDIVTRPDTHLELTRTAASHNVAVICQKPLAPDFPQAVQLVRVAEQAGTPLMIHENFRFQPWYRELKRLLDGGAIGGLHTISFRCRTGDGWQEDAYLARQPYFREMKRFLIFETGVHFVDTFRYLGGEIDGVYAKLRTLNREIAGEDAAIVLFEFRDGKQGVWDANRYNEPNCEDPRYTFGEATLEGESGTLRLYPDGRLTLQPLGAEERDHEYVHRKQNFAGDCVYATQQHFVERLRTNKNFETGGAEYLKTLSVQEAIYQSAHTGQAVRGLVAQGIATCE